MGHFALNSESSNARLALPTILIGQARRLFFESLTTIFVYDNFSIKKTWITLYQSL